MIKTIKYFIYIFKIIFLIPHVIFYLISDNRNLINKDINVNCKKGKSNLYKLLYLLISNRYYRNVFYYRIGYISYIIKWMFPADKTFIISNQTKINGGIYVAHPFATIINAKCIGENLSIRQCTTIGNKTDGRNDLVPTIGSNVTLGANVIIIGNIQIGNNVIIGAGSVVVHDVPNNSIVVGNPSKVIKKI